MKDSGRHLAETFRHVQEFGRDNTALFPEGSFAAEQLTAIDLALEDLGKHTAAQAESRGAARQGTRSKAAAREALMRTLEAISRTARPLEAQTPGITEKFRVPHNQSYQEVLAAARAIASAALPLKAEFIKRGMPADFLEDLQADIEALEEAHAHRAEGRDSHYEATLAIEDATERGVHALRELDPIMRNTLADDPLKLGAWLNACHVERPARRNKTDDAKPSAQDTKPTAHDSQPDTPAQPSGGA
jgi:hypothetical protein